MRFFYSLAFYSAIPFILLRLLWRSFSAPAYARRWRERFGFVPQPSFDPAKKVIWLHAVSVGEFIAALPLIRALQARVDVEWVITTTTPTGSDRVRASLGDSVYHVYAPYDLPDVLARFIRRTQPSLLLIMETELWPNTLAACAQRSIPRVLVNARMSERSARGYEKMSRLTRPMLQNLTLALVQNATDAQRLIQLGLPPSQSVVTGSIKFDLTLSDSVQASARELKAEWSNSGARKVLIAASTHHGEDDIILDAFAQLKTCRGCSDLLLVLVPRHPERFSSVFDLCVARGFSVERRSSHTVSATTDIVVGDTMGELLLLYGASDMAFVGGSFVANGGHNFIEPAAWRLPLLSGPHVFNFAEIARLLEEAGALRLVMDSSELANQVVELINNGDERLKRGEAAITVANNNRGALDRVVQHIEKILQNQ